MKSENGLMEQPARRTLKGILILGWLGVWSLGMHVATAQWVSNGPTGGYILALAIDPQTPSTIYAGTWGGGVFKSTNGGESWSAVNTGLTDVVIKALAIDLQAPSTIYAGTFGDGVYKSTDAGASWSAVNTGLIYGQEVLTLAIDPQAPSTIYAGTNAGVYKSTDGGASWSRAITGLYGDVAINALAVDPQTPTTVYVGIEYGVFKSSNGGESWSEINTGLPTPYKYHSAYALAIDPQTPATIYAGMKDSGVYRSTNGGASWSAINTGLPNSSVNVLAIDPLTPTTIYAAAGYSQVFKSTNGGGTWSDVSVGLTGYAMIALAIDPRTPATIYAGAGGEPGTYGSSERFIRGVFKSTNGGSTWSPINAGLTNTEVLTLAIDPQTPSTILAGIRNLGLFKSDNGGRSWSAVLGLGIYVQEVCSLAIDPQTPSTIYAGTEYSGLLKSTNGGASWSASNATLGGLSVYALAIDQRAPATIYAGTDEGVFKSSDGGASWSAANTGLSGQYYQSVYALALDPQTPSTIYAGIAGYGVFKSTNGGVSWSTANTGLPTSGVNTLVIDPQRPSTIYAGTFWDGAFKSSDGGASWSAVNTGLDYLVKTLAIDPQTGASIYAGTWGGGVSKSTNGGASWSAFNAGLTITKVQTLAIDPQTRSTIYAGTYGGGVFVYSGTEGCTYTISPASRSAAAAGYSGSVTVTAGDGCNWTAASDVSWITINSGSSGSGNGTVNYEVSANTGASSRSGTLTIAGQVFTVSQAGRPNPVPSMSALSPNRALAGSPAVDLTVVGSNFVPGSTVRWNNEDRSTTFLSSTQLRAVAPAADLASGGTASVTVFSPAPGGGVSNSLPFAVTNSGPALCCLNPISVVAGSPALSLIVYGSGFVPSSTVQWNGSSRVTSFVSSTELRAAIPAADVASAGTTNVTVSNPAPGGGISGIQTLSIITLAPGAPTITSVSPDVLPAGGESFTLTVNGTGFLSGSVVQFNGQDRPTTFVSATQLTVVIPASDMATGLTYGIVVVNPASGSKGFVHTAGTVSATQGISSNTGVVTVLNPVPILSGVTPSSARAGSGGLSVTAEGEKFVSTSTIRWNAADRATTYTNSSRLGGTILASDVASEGTGTASTSVSNPGPGGGTSNSLTFTIRTSKSAATTLYYPRLVTNRNETTGIAVANLSGTDAILTLWAFDKAGTELKGQEITNPASVSMARVEQLPILDWQVFGAGLPEKSAVGWTKVESTVAKIAGFFLTFNDTLSTMDGANVSSTTLTSIVFPEIEDEGFTQIHVANPDTATADLKFELYTADGTLRGGAVSRKVNSNGTVAESLTDLFPGLAAEGADYVRATSNKGVVPFEYLGKTGQYGEGLNGQDGSAGATVLYSPQYAAGSGYWTALSIVNLEAVPGTVTLELMGDDGTPLASAKVVSIPARGKLHVTDQKFFVDSGGSLVQGYVRITSSGPKLAGSVVFGDPERKRFSSSLPLASNLLNSAIFGQVASNSTYFTGIAILNPNEATATATIDVYDRNGNLVRTKAEVIGGKRRVSKLVTQYFEDLVGQDIASGYIKVTVDKGVASFALFGTNDLSVLSAIPPQVVP